jgi:hypothetical protein
MPGPFPFLALALAALLAAGSPPAPAANRATGCLDRFDPGTDYFPDKAVVESARGFSIDYHRSYKVLTATNAYPKGPAERYVLLPCGAPARPCPPISPGRRSSTCPSARCSPDRRPTCRCSSTSSGWRS